MCGLSRLLATIGRPAARARLPGARNCALTHTNPPPAGSLHLAAAAHTSACPGIQWQLTAGMELAAGTTKLLGWAAGDLRVLCAAQSASWARPYPIAYTDIRPFSHFWRTNVIGAPCGRSGCKEHTLTRSGMWFVG